jgi:hypothetical protein
VGVWCFVRRRRACGIGDLTFCILLAQLGNTEEEVRTHLPLIKAEINSYYKDSVRPRCCSA